jgi:hypothetical protein
MSGGPTLGEILKLFASYPAIAFWCALFGVSSFMVSSWIVWLFVRGKSGPIFPTVRALVFSRTTSPLIRIGTTLSGVGTLLAILATHRYATVTIAKHKSKRSFTSRTIITADVSAVIAALALLALGWNVCPLLATFVFFPAALISHMCVDLIPARVSVVGALVNFTILGLLLGAIAFEGGGTQLGWGKVVQFGSLCEYFAFIVIHMRFMINGETVLGARFLPSEIRPAVLGPRYTV